MLCAGVIHGDLSEFNVLVDADGPVIIDLPQAVDAAGNNHAARMLERDVNNMRTYFGLFRARAPRHQLRQGDVGAVRGGEAAPRCRAHRTLRAAGELSTLDSVLSEIEDARFEETEKRRRLQAVE